MLTVHYAKIPAQYNEEEFKKQLARLPLRLQLVNASYAKKQDRLRNLYGKLLLATALQRYDIGIAALNNLEYDNYNRPYLPGSPDFNISHSGQLVVCATADAKVGVDVEEVKPLTFDEYLPVMSAAEWEIIRNAPDPLRCFYSYWTKKESVIKADSRGLSIPLQAIHFSGHCASCEGQTYNLAEISIHTGYAACLASNADIEELTVEYIQL